MKKFSKKRLIEKSFIPLCLLLMMSVSISHGQDQKYYAFEHLVIKDGLSSNFVWDIEQDKYGYLWIATDDGLNKYDGFNIQIFRHNPADSTSLPDNKITSLHEDKEGILWVGTANGLSRLNRKDMSFETYNVDTSNTIAANGIRGIYEDSKGKLWLGTDQYGTVSFDRKSKKINYYQVIYTGNSLMNFVNGSWRAIETSKGDLIVGSNSYGILKFDAEAQIFVLMQSKNDFLQKFHLRRVFDFYEDDNQILWIAASDGIYKLNLMTLAGEEFSLFDKKENSPGIVNENTVLGIFRDKQNRLWFGTYSRGLFIYDPSSKTSQNFTSNSLPGSISSNTVWSFFEDRFGILWFGSTSGANKFDPEREPFELHSLKNENNQGDNIRFYQFAKSFQNPNKLWLSSQSGLYQFDMRKKKITKSDNPTNKKHPRVSSSIETTDGMLWIGTSGQGLFASNLKKREIDQYKFELYNEHTLNSNFIYDLNTDSDGNIWIGSNNGLNVLDPKTKSIYSIPTWSNRTYNIKIRNLIDSLYQKRNPISSIVEVGNYIDQSKEFAIRSDIKALIVSMGEGLPVWGMVDFGWLENASGDTIWSMQKVFNTFSAEGNAKNRMKIGFLDLPRGRYKLRYKSDDSHSFSNWNVVMPKDSLWWGIQLFEVEKGAFQYYGSLLKMDAEFTPINNENVRVVEISADDRVWLGTDDGLSIYNPKSKRVVNYLNERGDPGSLSNNSIKDIREDKNGIIWIATDGGLNRFDPKDKKFNSYTFKDGLPTDKVSSVEFDTLGNVWVSTRAGISRLNEHASGGTPLFVNYDVADGLQGYSFFYNSSYRDKNGQIYFSGRNGFNTFTPGRINNKPPAIAVTNILISGKSIRKYKDKQFRGINLLEDHMIKFPYDDNDLSFEFASIHFARPGRNKLVFQMKGIDPGWQDGHRRFASYTNLDPGSYTFMVKGSNGDGVWSEDVKAMDIIITPPWWSTWWAYLSYFLLGIGFLYSARNIELRRKMKDAKLKESHLRAEAAELQAKAAEAQNRVIQIEIERKSKELEEARELQLSMLPQELPQLPHLDIAVYMKTATEVGGDYYDFNVGMDGTLTVVIGDATGHGVKAGTMVTTAKSLFNTHAANPDIIFTFNEITRCIKKMHMQMLSMCLSIIKFQGKQMILSAAGMPPVFHYQRDIQSANEITLKGMPLGTMEKYPYELKTTDLNVGDTLLLMTDGMPELMNDAEEMFGYKRIRDVFESVAEKAPEEIIEHLKNSGSKWVNDKDPEDDVTFVVIKVK